MSLGIRNKFVSAMSLCILMGSVFLWVSIPHAVAQESIAPLNPAFLEYQQNLQNFLTQNKTGSSYVVGYLPSSLNLSHLTGQPLFQISEQVVLPSSYDLRNLGKLTPVKNQGDCSSDWTFATYGSLESCLLPLETWDFSENNLKNTHGFDLGHCDGGNANMSVAYLARWSGPVSEADDAYTTSSNASPLELGARKHVQEALIIPARANALDNENIKHAIMTYGAVYTSMYFRNNYYSIAHKTYYYYGTSPSNRSVAIVGWDDDFNKSKFLIDVPGNGAFIVRNSLGTNWGESGYFYVSYYDSKIGRENYIFGDAEPATNYQRIYRYDPLGWVNSLGYDSDAAWFGNIFTSLEDERLEAISFHTASPNSSYEMYVYSNTDSGPTSGSLSGSQTGIIPFPGYHTIDLNKPIVLTQNQKFSIVVKLTTPGFNYPIPIEYPTAGYSSQATANPGESYISLDGITWKDLTSSILNANVCLKAFTIDMSPPQTMITSGFIDSNGATFTYTGSDDITPIAALLYATSLQGYDSGWSSFSSSTSKSYNNLPDGSYTFQVKAKDQAGNEDPTPATHSFSILSPPGQATLISPSGTITTMSPSFSWNAVSSATDYLLWVDDPTDTKIRQWYTAEAAGCAGGTGTCSVAPSITLAAGSCTWWIQTKNSAGTGPLSIGMAFAVEVVNAPIIPSGPTTGTPGISYSYSTGGSSSNLEHSIQYFFDWGDGSNSGWLPVGTTSASKSWASGGTYTVKAQARCATHTSAVSGWSGTLSVSIETVSKPSTPSGPMIGIPNTSYTYSTGGASSNLVHSVQYLFDWGDGTNTGWLPVGTSSASKFWASGGTYTVKAQARCATHTSAVSGWSAILSVDIEVISTPSTPSGLTSGIAGTSYSYLTGGSSSNLEHSVQYFFDWGDGTNSGWLPVGTTSVSKSWAVPGTYSVKAKARCATHNLIISSWSTALDVSMEKVTVLQPNGGEVIPSGKTYTIQWAAPVQATKFKLLYSMDNGAIWILITSDATGTSYDWTVPKPASNANSCYVKVIGYSASNVKVGEDESDKPFAIGVVKLFSPNGGEVLESGDIHQIQWEINGTKYPVATQKLYYSMDGGTTWSLITTLLDGSLRTYDWTVPVPTSNKNSCYVKVVAYSASKVNVGEDKSDKPFAIGVVKLVTPNGGEVLESGDIHQIQWEINGTKYPVATVKLYYSIDSGTTWSLITSLNGNPGTYDWTVPIPISNKNSCYVRVVAYSASNVNVGADKSDKSFTIGVVKLFSPNGGEVLESGDIHQIQWEINGTKYPVATVKLYYSVDAGTTWSLITSLNGNPGTYDWTVPVPTSNKNSCYVRVVAYSASNVNVGADKSDKSFTIGVVKLLTPNGGEVLESGDIHQIQWEINEAKYPVTTVKLYYSIDSGATWTLITTLVDGALRTYDWTVPVPTSNKNSCYVKVVAYSASNVNVGQDKSDKSFTIGVVKLFSPNGGEVLESGDIHQIQWEINGTRYPVATVKLYYTMDGGTTWSLITTLDGSFRSYDWIPLVQITKTKCKVKAVIYDTKGVAAANDMSDSYFTIQP
jgi:C1A family cysteine protease/uncharacterized OB-fold protein